MAQLFPVTRAPAGRGLGFLLGCGVALFIMLLVPLTQLMEPEREPAELIESIQMAPPPPPPPPEEPPPPPEPEEEPPPELKQPPPMPTLEQLEISLNPGTGGPLGLDIGIGFDFSTESTEQLEQIFGFGELDELPRLLNENLPFRYPPNTPRGRGNAFVDLLIIIDREGRVQVEDVYDFSHRELLQAARQHVERFRFSTPIRNGKPVSAKYRWRLEIPLR
jgi:protein TonB